MQHATATPSRRPCLASGSRTRPTKDGDKRYRVEYRLGGREQPKASYGGSFKTQRDATLRKTWIAGELAARRVPDADDAQEPTRAPTFEQAAKRWQAARVDVADSTRDPAPHPARQAAAAHRHPPRSTSSTAQDFVDVVAQLHGDGVARETIRKTLGAGAMALDHAGVTPNPARDRTIKLPREEPEEINPPSADHVEAVYRLLPSKHRLAAALARLVGRPRLARSTSPWSATTTSRAGGSGYAPRRRRPGGRSGSSSTRRSPTRSRQRLGPREDRDPEARLFAGSGADALRTAIAKACRAAGDPALVAARPAPPADLAAAPARHAVGADRRVRRPARPDRDREHLHPRARRRGRARLRRPARMSAAAPERCSPPCSPRHVERRDLQRAPDPTRGASLQPRLTRRFE